MKISKIIEQLKAWHAPLDHPEHTSDTIKWGNPEMECTGIAVTCFTSINVIHEAAKKGCNLIICHEPTFYGNEDDLGWLSGDRVLDAKQRLLEETGMVIWRDHDHMHGPGGPKSTVHAVNDWIFYGIMKELGWEAYVEGEITKPLWFRLPDTTVSQLADELTQKFNLNGLRIVGDPNASVSTVFICEHLFPGFGDDREIIKKAANADVMIPLEIMDWTLSEYVRDAAQLGYPKAILEMGHFNVEELGMKYMADAWLPEVVDHSIPVHYIQSGDSFQYYRRHD